LTNDGQTSVTVFWPNAAFSEVRTDIERHFMRALEGIPSLAERVRSGRRTEQFYGSADLPFFFRKPYGPGWALVGDAGYHKDPITAQGITDSFRDAELLAGAVDAGFSGTRELDAALADYERQRNEAAMPLYEFTYQLAGLQPPPPEMQQLFGALRHNQEQIDRFFGLIAGTTPFHEFFAPENLGAIMDAQAQGVLA
jgi:2-polyprenyl-6-methoxyphenol hydroxylase-like FAD-dependent oxidoreductase